MKNVVLIGMPGSGKSTLGVLIAKLLGKKFLDTDIGLQTACGGRLSDIIERDGMDAFRSLEREYLTSLDEDDTVIATGGSAVYYQSAMNNLKRNATVVYLKASYDEIAKRVGDLVTRGVVMEKGQTLKDLYDERTPLYEKYADITVDVCSLDISAAATSIVKLIP